MSIRPIATGVFDTSPTLRLIGGRERSTGRVIFPLPRDEERFERIYLPNRGSLWSYTLQRFAPKSPPYCGQNPFEPFAVGYVELPDACIVESILTDMRFEELRVGLPMELTTLLINRNGDPYPALTYAFRPCGACR